MPHDTQIPSDRMPADESRAGFPSTAVMTYADASCARGVEVLLSSFRSAHPGFRGDVLVIDGGIAEPRRRDWTRLLACRFLPLAPEMRDLSRRTARAEHAAAPWVLEAFRCGGYRRIVCISADALVIRDIGALFARDDALAAAPAGDGFDPGVLTLDGALAGADAFAALVGHAGRLAAVADCSDPVAAAIQSRFGDRIARLGTEFHFVIWDEDAIDAAEGLTFFDARILRFTGRLKPWHPLRLKPIAERAPDALKFIELWEAERARFERRLHPPADEIERTVERHVAWWKALRNMTPGRPGKLHEDWRFASRPGRPPAPDPRGILP